MLINKIHQFFIAAFLVMLSYIEARTDGKKFTLDQFFGEWYDIGQIPRCGEIEKSCSLYNISSFKSVWEPHGFVYELKFVKDISNYYNKLQIQNAISHGELFHSILFMDGTDYTSPLVAIVKSYNNGQDLIITEDETDKCPEKRYRLWSKNRRVSREAKAEFNKLAENKKPIYFPCPKLWN